MTQPYLIGGTTPSTTVQVPVGSGSGPPNPFSTQTTTLDGVPFLLSFAYSQRECCWYLSLATVDGDPIWGAVKLVCSWPLFKACADARKPAGDLIVISSTQDLSPPGLNDLQPGGRCALMYVTAADEAAIFAAIPQQQPTPLLSNLTPPDGGAAPLEMDGMLVLVPGTGTSSSGSEGPIVLTCAASTTTSVTLGGDPTYQYTVVVRIRGLVQLTTPALAGTVSVSNGSPNVTFSAAQTLAAGTVLFFASQPGVPYFVATATSASTTATLVGDYSGTTAGATTTTTGLPADGAMGLNAAACLYGATSSGANLFKLTTSAPAATFLLNAGTPTTYGGNGTLCRIDYSFTLGVYGGSTVSLAALTGGTEVANQTDGQGAGPLSVVGVAVAPQPYNGQFVQLNVGAVR
jgi:hypothetical protein